MIAVCEKIMSMWSQHQANDNVYQERIKCFEKLITLQRNIQSADTKNSSTADKDLMESYSKEYKKEYELCEKIMKY